MVTIDFTGKNYIVTGGAGSIGRAIVETVVACGGRVCAIDIDRATLEEMSKQLPADLYCYRVVDLSSTDAIRKNFAEIIAEFGQLHGLVNCVGVLSTKLFEEISQEEWNKIISINLTGVFAAIQSVFTHMKANRYGRIVNVSSVAGKVGGGLMGRGAYATSKAGVNGLTKVVAKEGGPFNVCCNTVCPGWTDSRMINELVDEANYNRLKGMVSMARPASAQEAAWPVVFYLSDLASFVNGEISDVDGGLTYDG